MTALLFRELVTHIHQKLDFLVLHGTVQCHCDPMGFVHVPAREDTRFHAKRTDQSGIAFEIDNADLAISDHPQLFSGDVHRYGKLFLVSGMPKYLKIWITDKEIFAGGMIVVCQIDFQFISVHNVLLKPTIFRNSRFSSSQVALLSWGSAWIN